MLKHMIYGMVLLCSLSSLQAQNTQYAADLRESEDRSAWLGLVNPGEDSLSLTITGYDASGTALGSQALTLDAFGKLEMAAGELFPGSDIAWASVTSSGLPVGYVRFSGSSWMSMVPLSRTSGSEVWVPEINDSDEDNTPVTVLVNTSEADGQAISNPQELPAEVSGKTFGDVVVIRLDDISTVPGLGNGFAQAELHYPSVYSKSPQFTWDRITTETMKLTAVTHLTGKADNGTSTIRSAAFNLPRTPYRRMVVGPMQPLNEGGWNKLVLINTNDGPLRVEMIPHYAWYGTPPHDYTYQNEPFDLILEAGERRVFNIDVPTQQNLPARADWYDVIPHDGGLLGYQVFGTKDGQALGAVEAGAFPGSNRVIPHVVTNDTIETRISLINTGEEEARGTFYGYNSQGTLIASYRTSRFRAYEKATWTCEELFGEKASSIQWVKARFASGYMATHAIIMNRDKTAMAGLQGIPTIATTDEPIFTAKMEQFHAEDLMEQGWDAHAFTLAGRIVYRLSFESENGNFVQPGEFWIENSFNAENGDFYLGYEPYHSRNWAAESFGIPERVALMSPYIEVPAHGSSWYLSYRMRFHNPLDATTDSRYGLMWRVEGEEEWHWFGLYGNKLLNPDNAIGDCWAEIQWRDLWITVTPWFTFETALPPEVAGKRIQLAYFYDHLPETVDAMAPWLFMDNIVIKPAPTERSLFYPINGAGTVTEEELETFEEIIRR